MQHPVALQSKLDILLARDASNLCATSLLLQMLELSPSPLRALRMYLCPFAVIYVQSYNNILLHL